MNRDSAILILICICILHISNGCATLWKAGSGEIETEHWAVEIPKDWMRLETGDYQMFSKYGPYLQYFLIQTRLLDRPFLRSKGKMVPDMLPHEAAQTLIDDLRADPGIRRLEVTENRPVLVNGHMGFKLCYCYQDALGVTKQTHLYGMISKPYFISLRYTAARRHYFDENLADFERVLKSFRLSPT